MTMGRAVGKDVDTVEVEAELVKMAITALDGSASKQAWMLGVLAQMPFWTYHWLGFAKFCMRGGNGVVRRWGRGMKMVCVNDELFVDLGYPRYPERKLYIV